MGLPSRVLTIRSEPFPFEAVRDLLGVVRTLYATWQGRDSKVTRCRELRRIGESLRAALKLAAAHEPGTLGHAAAWKRADEATLALGNVVSMLDELQPVLETAVRRVRRR
jgi:hypothetical protein